MNNALDQLKQRRAELLAQVRGLDEAISIVERATQVVSAPAPMPPAPLGPTAATSSPASVAGLEMAEGHSSYGLTKRAFAALEAIGRVATWQEVAAKCPNDKEQSVSAALYRMSDPKQPNRKIDRVLEAGEQAKFVTRRQSAATIA
ncbi:MAG: hypothetical protein FJ100_17970 [Deltaproteobacteria bacterium]|nr:hypothetical protein [Deltaproteobacteria bacterium]